VPTFHGRRRLTDRLASSNRKERSSLRPAVALRSARAPAWRRLSLALGRGVEQIGQPAFSPADRTPPTVTAIHLPVPQQTFRLLTASQARNLWPLPWRLIKRLQHGQQLEMFVTNTGCSPLKGVLVRQTRTQVIVTALGPAVPANQPCAGTGGGWVIKVQLPALAASKMLSH
jgi:hypothetical protein